MKIHALRLVNFRNHADTYIPLERVNILVGLNGAGKSSLQGAIEYLLTGRCAWTDGRGTGAEDLIRHGQKEAVIEATIEGIGKVRRTIPGGVSVEGWSGTTATVQKAILERLGTTERVISAVLNTSAFVEMPPSEQKNMLFALMGLEFDQKAIKERLLGWAATGNLFETGDMLAQVFDHYYPDGLAGGAEVFDALDKIFREARRIAKKDLKALEERVRFAGERKTQLPDGVTLGDKEAIVRQLQELRQERDRLAAIVAQADIAMKRLQIQNDREARIKAELVQIEAALAKPLADISGLEKDLSKVQKDYEQAQIDVEGLSKRQAALGAEISSLDKMLTALKGLKGLCPLAPGQLVCPHPEEDIEELRGRLEADRAAKEQEKTEVDAALQEAQARLRELRSRQADLSAAIAKEKEAAAALERAKTRREELLEALADVERERAAIGEPLGVAEAQMKLKEIEARIAKGENLLASIHQEERALAELQAMQRQLQQKRAEVGALEKLVEAFGPNGIKQDILREIVGPVQRRANERLAELTDGEFSLSFDLEGGFEIRVHNRNGSTTKLQNLSTSEKMRVGIVLQDVLNSLTGLGIMVIDDAEHLDPDNKVFLINTLLGMEEYGTIILLAAKGETEPEDPGIPGLAIFVVENGQVRRLVGREAA